MIKLIKDNNLELMVTELKTRDFVLVPEGARPAEELISQALRFGARKRFHGASGRELSIVAYTYRVGIEDVRCPKFCLEGEIDSDLMATFNLHTREDNPDTEIQLVNGRHPDMRAGNFVRFMLSKYFPEYGYTHILGYRSCWRKSSDNYQQFQKACASNSDVVLAARNTWTGKLVQELGFSEVYPETIHQGVKNNEPFVLVDFYRNGTPYERCLKPINPWILKASKT